MSKSDFNETKEIVKASAAGTYKKHKGLIIGSAVFALLAIVLIIGTVIINTDEVSSRLIYSFIPDQLYIEEVGRTFYSELNEDYDSDVDGQDLLATYKTYYITVDENGNEVKNYIDKTEVLHFGENGQVDVNLVFLAKAAEKLAGISKIVKAVAAVMVVCAIAFGIYLWYLSYKKREAAAREKVYKNKNENRHNK